MGRICKIACLPYLRLPRKLGIMGPAVACDTWSSAAQHDHEEGLLTAGEREQKRHRIQIEGVAMAGAGDTHCVRV